MASNVFGTPVTNETLQGLPEFHDKTPSQQDRARVALEMKNAEGKDVNAQTFGEEIQRRRSNERSSAIVLIYNATGNPLMFKDQRHWEGRVVDSPIPTRIENGQWGVFVQGTKSISRGGVIYTGQSSGNQYIDWVLCWSTSYGGPTNQVSTEIGVMGRYDNQWDQLNATLSRRPLYHYVTFNQLRMEAAIANTAITLVEATCTFQTLWGMPDQYRLHEGADLVASDRNESAAAEVFDSNPS